jgi:hypothetical protein
MANVYIEPRPKARPEGSPIDDYVVEDHADHVLKTFNTQREAIEWAKAQGHHPLVARVRHLNDKKIPSHWRSADGSMVNFSYHAAQQVNRLSSRERNELRRALESGELQKHELQSYAPGRFVSRFGKNKKVVWSRDNSGGIVVLTVVAE